MASRERILTALNHREPDRVPVDLGPARGWTTVSSSTLRHHPWRDFPVLRSDVVDERLRRLVDMAVHRDQLHLGLGVTAPSRL